MTDFSYQLYSSRNFGPLGETLKMLSELGYAQVEGYGGIYGDEAAMAALPEQLAKTGLTMPTGHFGLDQVTDQKDRMLEIAKSLNMEILCVPHTTEQDRDAAGWAAFGRDLAEAGKPFWDAGLKFGWHNHDFEFRDLGGQDRPLDLILAADDRLALELDVAWVVQGGQDPLKWIEKYADRIVAAHVKDIAPAGECVDQDGWEDVGHGTMDWPAIMGALGQTRAKYFVMEHDNPSDDRRFASRSISAAKNF